jgi:hypothetical protein
MATVVPINNDDEEQQTYFNHSYPPRYTALNDNIYDKPPSYEETVQHLSETNNTTRDTAAILPVTTVGTSSAVRIK